MTMIADNITLVRATLAEACERAGRDPNAVTLIAVSKTQPASAVVAAIEAGVRDFGENRVDEAAGKIPDVAALTGDSAITWHMIGHIQSRKAKAVAPLFPIVHSVDSVNLAGKLALTVPNGRTLRVLLECNVSGEASKGGFAAVDWQTDPSTLNVLASQLEQIDSMTAIEVVGLMTMAPIADDMEQTRPVFRSLRLLRNALQYRTGLALPELSMGMTDDYSVAVAEGATLVRVGRAIFGERSL